MELLREFYQEYFIYSSFSHKLEQLPCADEDEFEEDRSGYVYVDGEEGDYGVIKYTEKASGQLVAVRQIDGGDSERYNFTPYGKVMLGERLIAMIKEQIEEIKNKA